MALTISGNIQDTPLPDVLEGLRIMKATGTLVIRPGNAQKSLYLEEGKIIFAASTNVDDRLGEVLVQAGKLSKENLEAALQISKRTAGFKKLGAILVENGFVTPKDLFAGLKLQVKEIIYSIFILDEGSYRFDKNLPPDIIPLQINMQELIQEIIQRMRT
jgi:hypothetical protein